MDLLNPPTNYIGTALFLSYILVALVLTARALLHLHTLHFESLVHDTSPASAARFATLATAAFVIFATLSYNMVSFLAISYTSFCEARGLDLLPADLPAVFGQVGHWMLSSTLFADFARDLVVGGTAPSRAWAQTALVWSLGVSVFVGTEGKRRWTRGGWAGGKGAVVVALAQVLPVSFALVLWLMGDVDDSSSSTDHQTPSGIQEGKPDGKKPGEDAEDAVEVSPAVPAAAVAYLAALPFLAQAARESMMKLIGVVFLLRACLAVPYLASKPAPKGSTTSSTRDLTYGVIAAGGLVQLGLVWSKAVTNSSDWVEIVEGIWENPAVGAVAMDAVFGAFSTVVFVLVD